MSEEGKYVRLKIVSDGTYWGSKVIDTETGRMLPNVASVEWRLPGGNVHGRPEESNAVAVITLLEVPVELEVEGKISTERLKLWEEGKE